jgi:hypothetical protein
VYIMHLILLFGMNSILSRIKLWTFWRL